MTKAEIVRTNQELVRKLIEIRKDQRFSAWEIACEAGLSRQTVYKHIRKLNAKGYEIVGEASFGFVARQPTRT